MEPSPQPIRHTAERTLTILQRPSARDTTERVERLQTTFRYILYVVVTVFLFTPFVMTVLSSFKSSAEVIAYPPTFLPSVWHPENYLQVFIANPNFFRQIFNGVTLMQRSKRRSFTHRRIADFADGVALCAIRPC